MSHAVLVTGFDFGNIFEQAFGGGGGFQFNVGGGNRNVPKAQTFPRGIVNKISDDMDWLKGTEWFLNSKETVKFGIDGFLLSSMRECSSMQQCLWAAYDGTVFVMMAQSGLYRFSEVPRGEVDLSTLPVVFGKRDSDGVQYKLKFSRVFDNTSRENALDLYALLGVAPDADFGEIKKAYRRLMLALHPDQNPDNSDQTLFNQVTRANEILSDPTKRLIYDTSGMEGVRAMDKGELPKGQDVLLEVSVPLHVLFSGGTISPTFKRRVVCRGCRHDSTRCSGCVKCPSEIKTVNQQVGPGFFVQQQVQVDSKEFCKFRETPLEIQLLPGTTHGQEYVQVQMGEERPGIIPGNVVVRIKQQPDAEFSRDGKNLHTSVSVSVSEALLGFTRKIPHLDKHIVTLAVGGTVQPNDLIRVADEGMPQNEERGDLFVTVKVEFPKKLTPTQKLAISAAFESETSPVDAHCRPSH